MQVQRVTEIKQVKLFFQNSASVFAQKKTLSFVTLSLLLITIPLTVIQSLNTQDIRQHAADAGNYSSCTAACDTNFNTCKNTCNTTLAQENVTCSKINYLFNPAATEIDKERCYTAAKDKFHECLDKPGSTSTCIGKNNSCYNSCLPLSSQCQQAGGTCVTEGSSNGIGLTRNDSLSCDSSKHDGTKHCYIANTPPGTQSGSDDRGQAPGLGNSKNTQCYALGGENTKCSTTALHGYGAIDFGCYDSTTNLGTCYHETDSDFGKQYVACIQQASQVRPYNPPGVNTACRCYADCMNDGEGKTVGQCRASCGVPSTSVPATSQPNEAHTECNLRSDSYCDNRQGCDEGYTSSSKYSCIDNGKSFGSCCVKTTKSAPIAGTPSTTNKDKCYIVTGANLRSTPDKTSDANILPPTLKADSQVVTTGNAHKAPDNTEWFEITTKETTPRKGWISSSNKVIKGACATGGTGAVPGAQPQITPGKPTAEPKETPGTKPATATVSKGSEVSVHGEAGYANLREKAGVDQKTVGQIKNGTTAKVIGGPTTGKLTSGTSKWWNITILSGEFKNKSGWMSETVLKIASSSTTTPQSGSTPASTSAPGKGECLPSGFYAIGGEQCATPSPSSGAIKPPTGAKPSSPVATSTSSEQITCSDNPIPAPLGQIWRAYCSNSCVTNSDCKSLPGWPTDPGSSQCHQFTNGSYCLQLQYNNVAGLCRDNPITPPGGLQWKAACSSSECTKNSDCPTTPGMENSNWCYGFDDGARCVQLQVKGSTVQPSPLATPADGKTLKAISDKKPSTQSFWSSVTQWFKNLVN